MCLLPAVVVAILLTACGPKPQGDVPHPSPTPSPAATVTPAAPVAFPAKPNVGYLRMFGAEGWTFAFGAFPEPARAFRTTDAGARWTPLAVRDGVVAMFALDADHAWVAVRMGSRIYMETTASAGRTWSESGPLADGEVVTGLRFLDTVNGTLTIVNAGGNSSAFRTRDGGATWRPLSTPSMGAGCEGSVKVHLKDPTHIYASPDFCRTPASLYFSADDGVTWTRVPLPGVPWTGPEATGYAGGVPEFPNPMDGYLVGAGGVTTGANALRHAWLFRTRDGGKSWTVATLPATPSPLASDFSHSPSIWFSGAENGDNERPILYHSRDGGVTWERLGLMRFQPLSHQFSDDLHGYAAGFDAIYVTVDWRRTWVDARGRA